MTPRMLMRIFRLLLTIRKIVQTADAVVCYQRQGTPPLGACKPLSRSREAGKERTMPYLCPPVSRQHTVAVVQASRIRREVFL